ncbi:MAG: hypothetical protein ABWY57_15085 [Mycetocola sp.]
MAYSVREAAETSGVSEQDIKIALQTKELVAREIGEYVVITAADIGVWLQAKPVWGDAA